MNRPVLIDNFTDWDLDCIEQGFAFVHFDAEKKELFCAPWALKDCIFVCKFYTNILWDLTPTYLALTAHERIKDFSHTLEISETNKLLVLDFISEEHPEVYL